MTTVLRHSCGIAINVRGYERRATIHGGSAFVCWCAGLNSRTIYQSRGTFSVHAEIHTGQRVTRVNRITKECESPLTGGTDNHLLVVDARPFEIAGRRAEGAMREAGITVNRNLVPFDTNGAWYTSGLRLGTPALTTLGFGKDQMIEIAGMISDAPSNTTSASHPKGLSKAKVVLDSAMRERAQKRAADLPAKQPLYSGALPGGVSDDG